MKLEFKKIIEYLSNYFFNNKSVYSILKRVYLFQDLSRHQLKSIAENVEIKIYFPEDLIIKEGDLAKECYIIKSGLVEVFSFNEHNEKITLSRLESPSIFGEQALLDAFTKRRNASVKALSETTLICISSDQFTNALNKNFKMEGRLRHLDNKQILGRLSKKMDIFQEINKKLSNELATNVKYFSKGHVLFSKGDEPDYIYYIVEGKIKISLEDNLHSDNFIELLPGQLFGELSFTRTQPRMGTATVVQDAKLLCISYKIFEKIYSSSLKMREFISTLNQVYENPVRGIVSQYRGNFSGSPTINTSFHLPDGRIVSSSQVIGKNIFSISHKNKSVDYLLHYENGNIIRDIEVSNNRFVGATITGYWEETSYLCSLILDNTPVSIDQCNQFKCKGLIKIVSQPSSNIICHCMSISRDKIISAIQAGKISTDAISQTTGAGTVCGACRMSISQLLGNNDFSIAKIDKISKLNDDVRIYYLRPNKITKDYLPGQHIVIKMLVDNFWVERSYTLISLSGIDDTFQIAVKLERNGLLSTWLFANHNQNPLIRVSEPQGNFILGVKQDTPVVFFAAGIGITPAIAFARKIYEKRLNNEFYIDYSEHDEKRFIFKDEFLLFEKCLSNFKINFRVTANQGRLTFHDIKIIVQSYENATFYICGPTEYIKNVSNFILSLGIKSPKIKTEYFTFLDKQ